jgi:hypothetical protein
MTESKFNSKTCISDQPLTSADKGDALNNNKYARGLVNFIKSSDSPITIGIQGGWGSGKTSLINMLQIALNESGENICVNVNAWQQSLFTSGAGGEIAIALLDSVLVDTLKAVKESQYISDDLKSKILKDDSPLKKAGMIIGGIGVQLAKVAAKNLAGVDGLDDLGIQNPKQGSLYKPSQTLRSLQENLNKAIKDITSGPSIKNLVIFVDDLDRIQPNTAVEILDVLKNIFDIPGCISILAVDYEVVIKGLKEKFGEKTLENEREFRQYFDKIIQVPFSMPTGAYRKNINPLLNGFFETLGIGHGISQPDRKRLADIAWKATDGVPRSIKRIVNTMSLLRMIQEVDAPDSELETDDSSSEDEVFIENSYLQMQFIVVCLQINFPEIYRAISHISDFKTWNRTNLADSWQLDNSLIDESKLKNSGDKFDEEWKRVIFLIAAKHPWLKAKSSDISDIMNSLKEIVENIEDGQQYLNEIVSAVNVVSAEPDSQSNRAGNKGDHVTARLKEILQFVIDKFNDLGLPASEIDVDSWAKKGGGGRILKYKSSVHHFSEVDINWVGGKTNKIYLKIKIPPRHGSAQLNRLSLAGIMEPGFSVPYGEKDYYEIELYSGVELATFKNLNIQHFKDDKLPVIEKFLERACDLFYE